MSDGLSGAMPILTDSVGGAPPSSTTVYGPATFTGSEANWGSCTFVAVVPAAAIAAATGTQVRLTVEFTALAAGKTAAVYFGQQAASGDVYDFNQTPAHVTFSGGNITGDGTTLTYVSDWVVLPEAYDETKNYLITADFSGNPCTLPGVAMTGGDKWYVGFPGEAAIVDKSSYLHDGSGDLEFVKTIEIRSGSNFSTYVPTDNPAAQNTGSTSATFSDANIGVAASNRIVVVCVNTQTAVCTGVTVGGITATKAVEESTTISGLQIWYAAVPTGTTADIVLTSASGMNFEVIQVGVFYQGASATPSDTHVNSSGGASPQTVAVTIPTDGFGIYWDSNSGTTPVWSGSGISGNDFSTASGSGQTPTSAHSTTAGSVTGTMTYGGAGSAHLVAASWGP